MQVVILDDDPEYQARLARALMARGFQIACVDSLAAAEAMVRMDLPDLLILGERVHGRLSHSIALLADCKEPGVPSIFITDRQGEGIAELFELIPAVYSVMGRSTAPGMVAQIAVAAVASVPARVRPDPAEEEIGPPPVIVPVRVGSLAAEGGKGGGQAGPGRRLERLAQDAGAGGAEGAGAGAGATSYDGAVIACPVVPAVAVGVLSARIEDEDEGVGVPRNRAALAASLAQLPPPMARRLHLG